MTMKKVLIMAGGTGGHIFPGLAIANYLREHSVEVHWLGTPAGLEARLIPEAKFPLHLIEISGLRGKGIRSFLTAPFKLAKAIFKAKRIINNIKPDVVLGMGGFVSGPGAIAAWLGGYPLVIHEQNAKAGFTNQWLSPLAKQTLEAFPNAFKRRKKVLTIGNPVRQELELLKSPIERLNRESMRILILGGSLGAQALNETIPKTLALLSKSERPEIIHQTGEKHFSATKTAYEALHLEADVRPFIRNMAEVYEWADLIICRAGALTVSEVCTVGLAAIFIPFPHAVDDHQTANAQFVVKNEGAICLPQSQLTPEMLAELLKTFIYSPEKRLKMAEAAYQLRNIRVPEKVFDILSKIK